MNETSSTQATNWPSPTHRHGATLARLAVTLVWLLLLVGLVSYLTTIVPKDVSTKSDSGVVQLQLNEGTRSGQEELARWVGEDRSLQPVTDHLEGDQKFLRAYGILIPLASLLTFVVLRMHSAERVALPLALTAILAIGATAAVDELLENPALDRIKVEAAASGRRGTLDTRMVNSALARELDELRLSAITKFLLASLGLAANIGLIAIVVRRQPLLARLGWSVVIVGLGVVWWRGALGDLPLISNLARVIGFAQDAIEGALRLVPVSAVWSVAVWLGALVIVALICDQVLGGRRRATESAGGGAFPTTGADGMLMGGTLRAALLQIVLISIAAPGLWLVVLFFTSGVPLSVLFSSLLATAFTAALLMAALGDPAPSAGKPSSRRVVPRIAAYAAMLIGVAIAGGVTYQLLMSAEQSAASDSATRTARDTDTWAVWSRLIGTQPELVLLKSPDAPPRPGTGGGRNTGPLETISVPITPGDRRLFAVGLGWLLAAAVVGLVALVLKVMTRSSTPAADVYEEPTSRQVVGQIAFCLFGAGSIWVAAAGLWLGAGYLSRGNPLGLGVPLVGAVLSLACFIRSHRATTKHDAELSAANRDAQRGLWRTSHVWGALTVLCLFGTFAWVWLKYAAPTPLTWIGVAALASTVVTVGFVLRPDRTSSAT